MKKLAALLLLTVFVSASIFAGDDKKEDPTDKKFHFGLKATPGLFWVKGGDKTVSTDGMAFGFGYGLITEFKLADNIGFATGLEIASLGSKFTQVTTITTGTVVTDVSDKEELKLQYIQIPLTLKMKT